MTEFERQQIEALEMLLHNSRLTGNMAIYRFQVAVENELERLRAQPRYADPLRVVQHGYKAYSQSEEDGILMEIVRRLPGCPRTFIEIGVETGVENNSLYLLAQGWKGVWIDANPNYTAKIRATYADTIAKGQLKVIDAYVSPDNINALIAEAGLGDEIGMFSLDIDGNDYHVLETIRTLRPWIVIQEYNGKFRPPFKWVMPYNEKHFWDGSDHFGASLSAFTSLCASRGLSLVGCNLAGMNAFFVRSDMAPGRFAAPFTAENHYEPPRYHLVNGMAGGHEAKRDPATGFRA